MNSLEGRLIMVRRLAAKGDEFLSALAHVPFVIECDPARKVALAMSLADVPPQNRVNLFGRRCRRCCERVLSRIEPPCNCARGTMALAGVMRALDGDVAMMNDRLEDLALLAPEKPARAIAHPATGSETYGLSGGSSRSAKVCHGDVGVAVKRQQFASGAHLSRR
jgi:hypothetical protein